MLLGREGTVGRMRRAGRLSLLQAAPWDERSGRAKPLSGCERWAPPFVKCHSVLTSPSKSSAKGTEMWKQRRGGPWAWKASLLASLVLGSVAVLGQVSLSTHSQKVAQQAHAPNTGICSHSDTAKDGNHL